MVMENRRFSKGDRLLFCSSEISITGKSEYPDSYRIISLHSTAKSKEMAISAVLFKEFLLRLNEMITFLVLFPLLTFFLDMFNIKSGQIT